MTGRPLRVLILEDRPEDAELVLHELRRLVRLAVRGGDVERVRNARLAQHIEGGLDPRLVALGSHENQHVNH